MRKASLGLKRTPAFHDQTLSQSLLRYALAVSEICPVKGLKAALLRLRVMCERRYSAPTPMARRPSEVCQATAGSTARSFTLASREMKRPTHGSCQFVRRPYGAITPTPKVMLLPIGAMKYAFGGTNVCARYLPVAPEVSGSPGSPRNSLEKLMAVPPTMKAILRCWAMPATL